MMRERRIQKKRIAWLVFLFGLLMTVYVSYLVKNTLEHKQEDQFDYVCNQVTLQIEERLAAYQLILQGGAAFFAGSETVSRKAWHDYGQTLLFDMTVPGVQGIGYAQVLTPEQLPAHIADIRKEGFPVYTVHPEGQRDLYTSIIYLEPFRDSNLRAFGYDMFSEPIRRAAMERARDTGNLSLSGKVKLVQDNGANDYAGTLMYIPIYKKDALVSTVAQKRVALLGWVYSPFRLHDFMYGILGNWLDQKGKEVRLSIYAGDQASPDNLLFNSDPESQSTDIQYSLNQHKIINFGGQRWTLYFHSHALGYGLYYLPLWVTLAAGLVFSILLLLLMNTIRNTKAKALQLADELTQDIRCQKDLLQEKELRYQIVADYALDWEYWMLPNGQFQYVSPSCERITGYSASEFYADPALLKHIIYVDDVSAFDAYLESFYTDDSAKQLDYRIVTKSGQIRWLSQFSQFIFDGDKRPLGLRAGNRDITSRKKYEDALRDSESRFKVMADGAPVMIWMSGLDKLCFYFNQVWTDFTGRALEQELGNGWVERVHPEDYEHCLDIYVSSFDQRKAFTMEYRLRRFDGEFRWFVDNGIPRYSVQGEFIGYIGSCVDITELKLMAAREALLVRSAHYDALTGLPNRILFNDRLEQSMAQMRRQKQMLALVYIDLDGFKAINDTYGHHAGDQVLSTVAKAMKKALREGDTLARLGGDEFVAILLEKGDINVFKTILTRLLEAARNPTTYDNLMLQVTASLGVAICTKTAPLSMEELIYRADKAMYVSKHNGKNCYHFFDVTQDDNVERVK